MITSADNIYHLTRIAPGKYLSRADKNKTIEVEIEDELMRPLVSGPEAKRYISPKTDTWLLFPYALDAGKPQLYTQEQMASRFPKGWRYLKQYEIALRRRENGKFDVDGWYQFGRNQNIDKQDVAKLMIPRLVTKLFCAIDESGTYYLDNVDVGGMLPSAIDDIFFLAGILNAPPANFVWRRISKPFQNDYRSANKQFIAPLPIPDGTPEEKHTIGNLAKELQALHSAYRDSIQATARLLAHDQMLDDISRQQPNWLWPSLPKIEDLKKSDTAKASGLKGAALTRWAEEIFQAALAQKLEKLSSRLMPTATLSIAVEDGNVALLVDGVEAFSAIEDDDSAELVAAQWRHVLRTTPLTASLTAQKLLASLLKLRTTENPALKKKIVDHDNTLQAARAKIAEKESAINKLIYSCYGLDEDEIKVVEGG